MNIDGHEATDQLFLLLMAWGYRSRVAIAAGFKANFLFPPRQIIIFMRRTRRCFWIVLFQKVPRNASIFGEHSLTESS